MALTSPSITPVKIGPNGTGSIADLIAALTTAAQSGGDAFKVQGKEVIVINNGSAASITVTLKSVASNFGIVASANDITQSVAAGKVAIIGPLAASLYADANGLCQVTWSAVTTVTWALYTFATTA